MDEKLKQTIEKIKKLASQNPEFDQAMQKLFGNIVSASVVNSDSKIIEDISSIRSALEIRAKASITYGFVKDERLRNQLIIDNLRMENAALNLQDSEASRFYVFCVNAFYQIENILNLFYHTTFPEVNALLTEIENATQCENDKFKFKRTGKEKNVGDISMSHKINAFLNSYIPNDGPLKWSIGTLRHVRNEGEHRCDFIRQEKDENNNLYKFFKKKTFNYVRIDLMKVVNAVEERLQNSNKEEIVESIIKSKLPSACFVSLRGESVSLPNKLFSKVKQLNVGDSVVLTMLGKNIIDVAAK